jgi:hypothetical protein
MAKPETTISAAAIPAALRDHACGPSTDLTHQLMRGAADEIERLRAALARVGDGRTYAECVEIARKAWRNDG